MIDTFCQAGRLEARGGGLRRIDTFCQAVWRVLGRSTSSRIFETTPGLVLS
jgi:hypothetical protein